MTVTLDQATVIADARQMADPDPEVPERARQRSFTATYKLEILACAVPNSFMGTDLALRAR